jgi:hypothetical protein
MAQQNEYELENDDGCGVGDISEYKDYIDHNELGLDSQCPVMEQPLNTNHKTTKDLSNPLKGNIILSEEAKINKYTKSTISDRLANHGKQSSEDKTTETTKETLREMDLEDEQKKTKDKQNEWVNTGITLLAVCVIIYLIRKN